jgi:CDP-diacylglycerol pyrophosphatase
MRLVRERFLVGSILAALLLSVAPAHADRTTLWRIVHGLCVVSEETKGSPGPCAVVDLAQGEDRGVALLKDIFGATQYLAIPTGRVTGIEDAKLLAPDAPNYFAFAWKERSAVEAALGHPLPRDTVAIAVNSELSRSQDQLHLHIDCVSLEAAATLKSYLGALDEQWRAMTEPLAGRRYWARRVDSADLFDAAPFRLLADGFPNARAHMGDMTLAIVGATFASGKPGFVLIAEEASIEGGGHSEDIQDHACAIGRPAP